MPELQIAQARHFDKFLNEVCRTDEDLSKISIKDGKYV